MDRAINEEMNRSPYDHELMRTFFVRRQWLHGGPGQPLSTEEYDLLKRRVWYPDATRLVYLRGFLAGYHAARA
jgi:hypothetical protein